MGKAAKIVVDKLIYDLQHRPSDFRCGNFTLKDKLTGVTYWATTGPGVNSPYEMSFGLWHGWRFHRALKKWKAADIIARSSARSV